MRLTAREKRAITIIKRHLPSNGRKYKTGSPVCGLLDLLVLFGKRLPYKLQE